LAQPPIDVLWSPDSRYAMADPALNRPKGQVGSGEPYLRPVWVLTLAQHAEGMPHRITAHFVIAASTQAETTVRSPLLYAWLTVQVLVILAVLYGLYRLGRKAVVATRRSRG
jgi:hypothetical protein